MTALDPGVISELERVFGPPMETDDFALIGTSAPFTLRAGQTLALRATLRNGEPGEVSAVDEATGLTLFTTTGGLATWRSAGQTFRLHSTADVDIDARVFLP